MGRHRDGLLLLTDALDRWVASEAGRTGTPVGAWQVLALRALAASVGQRTLVDVCSGAGWVCDDERQGLAIGCGDVELLLLLLVRVARGGGCCRSQQLRPAQLVQQLLLVAQFELLIIRAVELLLLLFVRHGSLNGLDDRWWWWLLWLQVPRVEQVQFVLRHERWRRRFRRRS